MHPVCKAVLAAPFLVWAFAHAQQSSVTSETTSTPEVTGITLVEGVPRVVRFSGSLNRTNASPGAVPILFSLYEEREGGTPLWQEAQTVEVDSQGKFTVLLGSTRKDGLPLDVFVNGKAHWLGIEVQPGQGEVQQSGEQSQQPDLTEQRVLLVGVPYALKAADADTLGGRPASAFLQAPASGKASANAATGATSSDRKGDTSSATPNASIGGSGKTNYIPLWLSGSTLANSVLFQNSGRVGIGTTAPASKFEVVSSVPAITLQAYNNATSGITAGLAGAVASVRGTAGIFNNLAGGPILSGRSKGIQKFVVDGSGNVSANGGSFSDNQGDQVAINVTSQGIALNAYSAATGVSGFGDGVDGVVGATFSGTGVHAIAGQSYSTAALLAEGRETSGVIANNNSVNVANNPTIWGYSTAPAGSQLSVVYASGNGGNCSMDSDGNLTCTGTKSAVVKVANGRQVALYAVESPENWFEDFGSAKLASGAATVKLDTRFSETVNSTLDYHVFLTPNGDCKGLFIAQKTPTSFEVRELGGGQSNISFDYRIVAHRKGYEKVRLADMTARMKPVGTVPDLKNSNRPQIKRAKQTASIK